MRKGLKFNRFDQMSPRPHLRLTSAACPYGRKLSELTLRNYEKLIDVVEQFSS